MTVFDELAPLDTAVLIVLAIAVGRGLWIGLVRESLSLAVLASAAVIARFAIPPVATWVEQTSKGSLTPTLATAIAGLIVVVATIFAVGALGRIFRRGVEMAGLGWADRLGGGMIGAAEGALVTILLVVVSTHLVGREHPLVANAQSVVAVDGLRGLLEEQGAELPSVALPGPWSEDE